MLLTQQEFAPYIINIALTHHFYSDAVFLAERLHAEAASDSSLHLLATSYYRAGKKHQAYGLLKSDRCTSPPCKYLLGKCCFELDKLAEAETVLAGDTLKAKTVEEIYSTYGETAPFVLALLADIYRKTERHSKAAELYKASLCRNPFLWSSFATLCQTGEMVDPGAVFSESSVLALLQTYQQHSSGYNFWCNPASTAASVAAPTSPASPALYLQTPTPFQHLSSLGIMLMPLLLKPTLDQSLLLLKELQHHQLSLMEPVSGESGRSSPASYPASNSFLAPLPPPPFANLTCGTASADDSAVARHRSSAELCNVQKAKANAAAASSRGGSSPLPPVVATPSPGLGLLPVDTPSPIAVDSAPFITPAVAVAHLEPPAPVKKVPGVTRKGSGVGVSKLVFSQSTSNARHEMDLSTPSLLPALTSGHLHNSQTVRRSSRIFANKNSSSVKENNGKTQGHPKAFGSRSAAHRSRSTKSDDELNELNKRSIGGDSKRHAFDTPQQQIEQLQLQSAMNLLKLLRHVGEGYLALQQYRCKKAVEAFLSVPAPHLKTGWMMSHLARAWFEMSDYRKADEVFREVRKMAPFQLEDMEVFSTTLWHLQKDVALSALALELGGIEVNSPEVWCVRGNCFSLQKEHETAIKFFQRAIQVNPEFSYAYTLLGHEYTLLEDFDKAMSCFRNAIRIDPRRYNAWYGVGLIYYKQEKFALAEAHFKKALSISPQSPVLLCHIGVVQHALSKPDLALSTLNMALAVDPKNPLCKFHKATVLLAKDRLQEALLELEELRDVEPKESLVYFLMGKVHKKLGNSHLALLNYSWAMDLDPKGANNHIKEAIDKRYVNDDELLSSPGAAEMEHEQGSRDAPMAAPAAAAAEAAAARASLMDADDAQLEASESDESL